MTTAAMELWVAVYPQLSGEVQGLMGALTARAEGQTIRLALIYALLDGGAAIDRVHLEAALAVWAFCDASTRFIFGDVTGDTIADAILRALRGAGATGKTRTKIYTLFNSNRRALSPLAGAERQFLARIYVISPAVQRKILSTSQCVIFITSNKDT